MTKLHLDQKSPSLKKPYLTIAAATITSARLPLPSNWSFSCWSSPLDRSFSSWSSLLDLIIIACLQKVLLVFESWHRCLPPHGIGCHSSLGYHCRHSLIGSLVIVAHFWITSLLLASKSANDHLQITLVIALRLCLSLPSICHINHHIRQPLGHSSLVFANRLCAETICKSV